jgi:poly(ribitol-phosphate) beta-N-acetylglucosaminyltransferase
MRTTLGRGGSRIRAALTRHGGLDDLLAVIRQDAEHGVPSTVVEGRRRFAAYPGLRDPSRGLPDECFEVTTAADWPARLDAVAVAWGVDERGGRRLVVTARSPAPDLSAPDLTAHAEGIAARTEVVDSGPDGTTVRLDFAVADLVEGSASTGQRRTITASVGSSMDGALLRAPALGRVAPLICRHGARLYAVAAVRDESGPLVISVVPVTPRRILARLAGLLRRPRRP